jgi:hypothetical protein
MRPGNATGAKRGRIGLYPAKTGGRAQTGPKRMGTSRKSRRGQPTNGRMAGSTRLKIAFPAPFKAVLEAAQHIKARIT